MFLARELRRGAGRTSGTSARDEEADLEVAWFDLDEAVADGAARRDHQRVAVGGLLAAHRARDDGWATLRPADTPGDLSRPARPPAPAGSGRTAVPQTITVRTAAR